MRGGVDSFRRGVLCASCALALWAAPATSGAQSRPDGPERPRVEGEASGEETSPRQSVAYLLSGYHYAPSRDDLIEIAAAETVAEILRSIAVDGSARPSLRTRAVDALALFPNETTESFLVDLLEGRAGRSSDDPDDVRGLVRHHAISSLAEILPDREAVDQLGGFLRAEEVQFQLTAITALGRHAGEPGRESLRERAQSARKSAVREQLKTYVDVPDGGGGAD